jgi:enoyl-[acyl-carrier-protein] reductase (NADH)
MDTLSFALGIATVAVIAIAIVAVYAFFKVRQLEQDNRNFMVEVDKRFEDLYECLNRDFQKLDQKINDVQNVIHSVLDSRLDKLENKLLSAVENTSVKSKLSNKK